MAAANESAAVKPLTRAQLLNEKLDFIETEEDVKAVESAALKIQSTFRGKKFGRKAKPETEEASATKKQPEEAPTTKTPSTLTTTSTTTTTTTTINSNKKKDHNDDDDKVLSEKVANMQVNDKEEMAHKDVCASNTAAAANPPEEEAERAATKIQAGFKGYKTRKELEGKLASGAGQQEAPPATQN